MLQIKAGVVIHVDYTINHLGVDGKLKNKIKFLNNEISAEKLKRYGLDEISNRLSYGVSKADPNIDDVIMPVVNHQLKNRLPVNTYTKIGSTITLSSAITLNSGAITTDGTDVHLRELGISRLSRVILTDEDQGIPDGIVITEGESIETVLEFLYTFYTNDRTVELEDPNFGSEVYYSSEVMITPNFSRYAVDNTNGFNHPDKMTILPVTENILSLATHQITYPQVDEYQESSFLVDVGACRSDVHALAYNPEDVTIYGFILNLGLHGISILTRFNKGIPMNAKSRYEVSGYLGWSTTGSEIDDGFTTHELSDLLESITINPGFSSANVERPIPSNDTAIQVNSLTSMEISIDGQGTITIPSGSNFHDVRLLGLQHGLQIDLYSNRVDNQEASTLDFIRPDAKAHTRLMQPAEDNQAYIAPVIIVGGNYTDVSGLTENAWRWESYYPYMGSGYIYLGYVLANLSKGVESIRTVNDIAPEAVISTVEMSDGGVSVLVKDYTAKDLLDTTVVGEKGQSLFHQSFLVDEAVDPSISNAGYHYKVVSDFDTPEYGDWVEGTTNIQANYQFLNLVPLVPESPQDAVTEITVTLDSTKHTPENASVWIDNDFIGGLTPATFEALKEYQVDVAISEVGDKTSYTLTKPYDATSKSKNTIYIFGNHHAVNDPNEIGYVKINKGSSGYKVFNKSGSDITNELYLEENPFLALGVSLSQPVPAYVFRNKLFTASEAARYFNRSIPVTLSETLFNIEFTDDVYSVSYAGELDSKSSNLNGNELYPAVGFDMGSVDAAVAPETVLLVDADNKAWTKQELLLLKTSHPELYIGDVIWFVDPVKLTEGTTARSSRYVSEFFGDEISLNINTTVIVTYTLESVSIPESPVLIVKEDSIQLTIDYKPTEAVITSIEWNTLDSDVAVVDQEGLVTAVEAGVTTVRALVNGLYIATAKITVEDKDIVVSCDLATNPSVYMTLEGKQFGLNLNGIDLTHSGTDEVVYSMLREAPESAVVNEYNRSNPTTATIDQTGYMELTGSFDVWVGGVLLAKDVSADSVEALLAEHPQLSAPNVTKD